MPRVGGAGTLALAQEGAGSALVGAQAGPRWRCRRPDLEQLAGSERGEHLGVDVGGAADRGSVPEVLRDRAHDILHHRLLVALLRRGIERTERGGGRYGRHPRTEVLGGHLGVGSLAQVVVHVVRVDRRRCTVVVEVLEQPLPGDLLALPEHAGDAPVLGVHLVPQPALAGEDEGDLGPGDARVLVAQGGEPVRAVVARVLVVPDPDERRLQQLYDGREDLLAGNALQGQIGIDASPHRGQRRREERQAVELDPVAERGPVRVVPVLQPSSCVATDCLQMRVGEVADPHVGPRGRDDDAADPLQRRVVVDPRAVVMVVAEATAPSYPPDGEVLRRLMPERRNGDGAHGSGSCPRAGRPKRRTRALCAVQPRSTE